MFFTDDSDYQSYTKNKVLYDKMPPNNLIFYAGWETEWYLIQIDPNGGQLAEGQSLFFWEPYNGDPIEEYTTVTRSFIESYEGTWLYAVEDRRHYGLSDEWSSAEDSISSRRAYYTKNQADPAISSTKLYKQAINAYRYAGWYEVKDDGTEELYAFGQPVQKNTKLKLHWKSIGTYKIVYAPG